MPLTEDCGIIEWVSRTAGLRQCCQAVYEADGRFNRLTNTAIKKLYDHHPVRCPPRPPCRAAQSLTGVLELHGECTSLSWTLSQPAVRRASAMRHGCVAPAACAARFGTVPPSCMRVRSGASAAASWAACRAGSSRARTAALTACQ